MRTPLAMLVFAALAAATTAARAGSHNDEVWLGGTSRALRTPSANALTAANLVGASVGYARDLGIGVVPGVSLWADAGVTTGDATGTMFQTMSTEIQTLGLTGGLRLRYQPHRLVAASARADLGAQRVRLDIEDRATSASDHRWGALASAGVVLDLFVRSRPRFSIGVRAEAGYVMAQAIELTPHRDAPSDVLALPMTELALGRLDLSGPSFAVSLIGQF
jgi:hypothetical protein